MALDYINKKKKEIITDWWNDTYLSLEFVHGGTTQDQPCLPTFITFYFSPIQISVTLLEITFFREYIYIYFLDNLKLFKYFLVNNDLVLLTDRDWPITTDLRHLSLTADNIMAKLTNQFIQTELRTFDWQQLFTLLRRWLPLRLSKRQSPLPTTVLLRTTFPPTIKLHYYMLPPGSIHILYKHFLSFCPIFF